jgi:DNA repair exonuclease SbcCD nuclease subunit
MEVVMSEVRLLHTADIHLDWLFESMPISKRQKRREELEAVFKHITNLAIEEGVDALLISGDLFHSSTVSDKSAALVKRQLASLSSAGIDTVIIAGNHDVGAFKGCFRSMTGESINVLTEDKWECLHLRCGLEVWGRSWVKPADSRILLPELESALRDYGSSCSPRVVMHHGQVMLGPQSSLSPYMPPI